jgi:hypothetical protein
LALVAASSIAAIKAATAPTTGRRQRNGCGQGTTDHAKTARRGELKAGLCAINADAMVRKKKNQRSSTNTDLSSMAGITRPAT